MKKFMYLIGLLTSIGMIMGVTFKILHMPGADAVAIADRFQEAFEFEHLHE